MQNTYEFKNTQEREDTFDRECLTEAITSDTQATEAWIDETLGLL